jgi:hypothetical protein
MVLSILHARVAQGDPGRYWMAIQREDVVGVVLQSPLTFPATLTPMEPPVVTAMADAIANAGIPLPGARENRTRRRLLAKSIRGLLDKTPPNYRASRVVKPSRDGDPYYVFLLLPRYPSIEEKDYRAIRSRLLREYCMVVKFHYRDAQHIIGIATEPLDGIDYRSEDFVHLDATEWNEDLNEQARAIKKELGIFVNVETFVGREEEYPVEASRTETVEVSRNSPCTCGSGKRYKRCHGVGMFGKKEGKLFRQGRKKGE